MATIVCCWQCQDDVQSLGSGEGGRQKVLQTGNLFAGHYRFDLCNTVIGPSQVRFAVLDTLSFAHTDLSEPPMMAT